MALEMFLASTEMAYAAGEISDEIHSKESSALDLGLEATKQELNWIKEAIIQIEPKETEASPEAAPAEGTDVVATEAPPEKASETSQTVQVEAPVEVTASITEAKAEEVQPPTDTPAETQVAPSEPGEGSFRQPSEETPK